MRILFTNTGPWGTGSFTTIEGLADQFEKLGHNVKIFFPDNGVDSPDKDKYYQNPERYIIWKFPVAKEGVTIPDFPLMIPDPNPRALDSFTYKDLSEAQLRLFFKAFSEAILPVIHDFQPDVIDSQHVWAMGYQLHQLGMTYLLASHNSDQLGFRFDQRMQSYATIAAQHAKLIFSLSDHLKSEMSNMYHIGRDKMVVMPNGYDNTVFKPQSVDRYALLNSLDLDVPEDALLVTFIGKMSKTKGIDTLLKANNYLKKQDNIHFLLFGSGDIGQVIPPEKREAYCFDRMHFLGHHVPEIIAKAHNISKLCVMPSRTEGFSIAALEAMGCGLPVVCGACGGMDKYVVGAQVAPEKAQHFAEAILNVIELSDQTYNDLSKQALNVARGLTQAKVAKRRLAYYESILGG